MTIRPVVFNGVVQRADDVGMVKHQEDAKPLIDQQNIQTQMKQNEDALLHQVTHSENADSAKNNSDAKDEGKGMYFKAEKGKKVVKKQTDGTFVKKKEIGGFDIKV